MYGVGPVDRMGYLEQSGAVAQLGERLICTQEVIGSIPFSSTRGWRGFPEGKLVWTGVVALEPFWLLAFWLLSPDL